MKCRSHLSFLPVALLLVIETPSTAWSNRQHALDTTAKAARTSLLTPTPPMGRNSYDCYGGDVNEQEDLGTHSDRHSLREFRPTARNSTELSLLRVVDRRECRV
jgi:hypothetical protein